MPSWTIATHDFTLRLNEDWNEIWTYTYPDQTPLDLTGDEIVMEMRSETNDIEVAMTISTDNGRASLLDPAAGKVHYYVPQRVLETLPIGTWDYDQRRDSVGGRQVLVKGKITTERGVTRAENEVG